MVKAIRVYHQGGPEVLTVEELPVPTPGPGEARVRILSIGLNFVDVYNRSGVYQVPLPFTPGQEAAGVVDAVGEGVTEVRAGDRVAWAQGTATYAEYALAPAWKLVPLPAGVSFEQAAALMLQGLTAHYLTHSTFHLQPGHRVLIHAAAGGVGLLLVQMAKRLGATVYATAGSKAKAALAQQAGADAAIVYTETDFAAEIKRLTGGKGVDCVYDSVGQSTFAGSLQCLRPRGYMVCFGQSSGKVTPFEPGLLMAHGSLFLTRPSLTHYMLDRAELLGRSDDLLRWVGAGQLDVRIDSTFRLEQVADAHRRIESRQSTGKILLQP